MPSQAIFHAACVSMSILGDAATNVDLENS